METRIALIGIIVSDLSRIDEVNRLLHDYAAFIVGRMGLPYKQRGINIISIVIDADNDIISALSGKLGRLKGISTKTMYSHVDL